MCIRDSSYMYAAVVIMPEEQFLVWKNYFPPDTTKKEMPVTNIDTMKTNQVKTDSTVAGSDKKTDSTQKNSTPTDMKKPDSLKK